jgi:RNA polymerase sigma factor (sigma-70 family)
MHASHSRNNPPFENKTDRELLALHKESHDSRIVGVLFRRYSHKLLGLGLNILKNQTEAEDAVMEVFEFLFKNLARFEIKNFNSWLYQVARNQYLKRLQKNMRIHREDISEINPDLFVEKRDGEDLYKERLFEKLSDAIDNLNEDQRCCITLFYYEQKSYQEIVEYTTYDFKQVKSHIQNGRRNLRNALNESI